MAFRQSVMFRAYILLIMSHVLMQAEDWTPLREVPKIMSSSDTPNIYQLRTNEMQDIMTPVENKISVRSRLGACSQQLYPLGLIWLGFELVSVVN